jgi:hypothetical protein
MIRPQRIPSPLTRGDRTRFHQLHWAKLAVDWGTAAIATTLLWRHHWVAAAVSGFGPSIVTTAVFLSGRFDAALGKIRNRPSARSIAGGLSPVVNAIRFGGVTMAWVGSWVHRPWWIPAGVLVVAFGWGLAWRRSIVGLRTAHSSRCAETVSDLEIS